MPITAGMVDEPLSASSQEDVVSAITAKANAIFGSNPGADPGSLQNLIDSLTAKVIRVAFEVFREKFDNMVQVLRNAYGQIARFVKEDFREHPSFYLGQLHALTEIAYRLGHQRIPREALERVARSDVATRILRRVAQEKSIGAGALARELGIEDSNLSTACRSLVQGELLQRERFGARVRYSPTALGFAVVAALSDGEHQEADPDQQGPAKSGPTSAVQPAASQREGFFADTGDLLPTDPNSMSDPNYFVSSLLNLAALRGARGIVIEPSGRRIRLEGGERRSRSEVNVPPSVGESLSQQLRNFQQSNPGSHQKLLCGQKVEIAGSPDDTSVKLSFVEPPDPQISKTKARAGFQRIQKEKKEWEETCVQFDSLMQDLNSAENTAFWS